MTDIRKIEQRYLNDPAFYAVVRELRRLIETLRLSPYEVREAAMFAVYMNELEHPQLIHDKFFKHDT